MAFTKVDVSTLSCNPFTLLAKQWMLVSAGTPDNWNTMTASWGGVGVIWGAPTATVYIRHSRYTKEFVDAQEYFTITFLQNGNQKALGVLGATSGRDMDKMHNSGLTPMQVEGQPTFAQAHTVFVCRKRYAGDLNRQDFLDDSIDSTWYENNDYHVMYLGEIVACYQNTDA